MRVRVPFDRLVNPSNISMLAVGMSFAAWVFPSFGVLRKGFDVAEPLDPTSILVLLAWYLLIFFSFVLGQRFSTTFLGKIRPNSNAVSIESRPLYYVFTLLAVIGMFTLIAKILSSFSISELLVVIALRQVNAIRTAPYENYSVGIISLRYLIIYSASLAIYKVIKHRKFNPVHIFNIILFILSIPVLSRLILVATVVTTGLLLVSGKKSFKIKFMKLGVFIGVGFLVLSALNYSRNATFYEGRHLSFGEAGFSEIISYLGSPFQVAVGTSKIMDTVVSSPDDTYRSYIDIEPALNTNSAFMALHEQMGYFAWPYICCLCFCMGLFFSWLFSFGKTIFLLPCGAILYASAELWRLDLFQQGIFEVWFIMGIGVPLCWMALQSLRHSLRKVRAVQGASEYRSIG
jgi:hypothetical protein